MFFLRGMGIIRINGEKHCAFGTANVRLSTTLGNKREISSTLGGKANSALSCVSSNHQCAINTKTETKTRKLKKNQDRS